MTATQRQTKLGCNVKPTLYYADFMVPETVVFALSTVFFCLRLANRASRMANWGWDDTTCVIAWVWILSPFPPLR